VPCGTWWALGAHKIEKEITHHSWQTMSHTDAHIILEELWFSIAEELFRRVCVATELDAEQIEALRAVALRPNDFQVTVEAQVPQHTTP
jgi:hypothetical protein